MNFKTVRLYLCPLVTSDLTLFHKINTEDFVRNYLWDNEIISMETAKEILSENARLFKSQRYGLWKIVYKDQVIGYTGLWFFFEEPQPQLLYVIREPFAGQGFAKEAASRIIDYTFNELDFSHIIAATDKPHLASQNLAIALGMHLSETRLENGKPTLFYRLDRPTPQ